jgi:hypothetical protein
MAFVANIKKNIFIAAAKRGVILDTLLLLVTLSIFGRHLENNFGAH